MIYVFEDQRDDLLSILFRSGYCPDVGDAFVYSEGCGNLRNTAVKQLEEHPSEHILIFVDVVPDNRELVHLYNTLVRLYLKYDRRILTLPVVCSEYYFIKSIAGTEVVTDQRGLAECEGLADWRNSALLETAQDRALCRNFEKYCKLFLLKNVKPCAKKTRGASEHNMAYGAYYQSPCLCTHKAADCKQRAVQEKAFSYLKRWPCIPYNPLAVEGLQSVSIEGLIKLNRKLCVMHNEKIREFGVLGSSEYLVMLEPESSASTRF